MANGNGKKARKQASKPRGATKRAHKHEGHSNIEAEQQKQRPRRTKTPTPAEIQKASSLDRDHAAESNDPAGLATGTDTDTMDKGMPADVEDRQPTDAAPPIIWAASALGDTVYIEQPTEEQAYAYLTTKLGDIPRHMVTFTQVAKVPEDDELL